MARVSIIKGCNMAMSIVNTPFSGTIAKCRSCWRPTPRITNPYDLVFHLRLTNSEISAKEAKAVWNAIAEATLKGDDLAKFKQHLEEDD